MNETHIPDWLKVGAKVAVVNHTGGTSVSVATVERFTATRVYLGPDNWYPLSTLQRSIGTWGGTNALRPLTDPQVRRVLAQQRIDNAAHKVAAARRGISFTTSSAAEDVRALKEASVLLTAACNKYLDIINKEEQ